MATSIMPTGKYWRQYEYEGRADENWLSSGLVRKRSLGALSHSDVTVVAQAPSESEEQMAQSPPAALQVYRGVVSHKRWKPMHHGFAYEIFMVLIDIDRINEGFDGLWPLLGVNSTSIGCFREADHMKLSRKPGQPLAEAVRDLMFKAIGYVTSTDNNGCALQPQRHLPQ